MKLSCCLIYCLLLSSIYSCSDRKIDNKAEVLGKCTLINSMGEIVGEPIQRVDIRGEHQLIYSLSNLANGIYIVNFRSGFYTKNECIMYVR
jgi:hypothetical protein